MNDFQLIITTAIMCGWDTRFYTVTQEELYLGPKEDESYHYSIIKTKNGYGSEYENTYEIIDYTTLNSESEYCNTIEEVENFIFSKMIEEAQKE